MSGYWLGMNLLWWIFWAAIIVAFFTFLTPTPRGRVRPAEGPLDLLDRRYAAGELTTAEYDERRARIVANARRPGGAQATVADAIPAPPPARPESETRGELRH